MADSVYVIGLRREVMVETRAESERAENGIAEKLRRRGYAVGSN